MIIETNGRRFDIDIDPLLFLNYISDKVDKNTINEIAPPNFSIVVRRSKKEKFKAKEGDYDIIIRKDSGEETALNMPYKGAKTLYVLTLLCQKAVGGLTNQYFNNERAAAVIKALYNKIYRSGGDQWVKGCAAAKHNLSNCRSHANGAIENNKELDNVVRYWCCFESEKRAVGEKQLQLRRIRISEDRIIFEDTVDGSISFQELMEQLPPFEDLFGFRNKYTERYYEFCSKRASMSENAA